MKDGTMADRSSKDKFYKFLKNCHKVRKVFGLRRHSTIRVQDIIATKSRNSYGREHPGAVPDERDSGIEAVLTFNCLRSRSVVDLGVSLFSIP